MDDGLTAPSSRKQPPPSVRQIFEAHAPYYLSIGMTYDDFYTGEPSLVILFRRAQRLADRRKEAELWRAGLYLQYAIASCFGEGVSYPERPFPVTRKEAEERRGLEEREALERDRAYMNRFIQGFLEREEGKRHVHRD